MNMVILLHCTSYLQLQIICMLLLYLQAQDLTRLTLLDADTGAISDSAIRKFADSPSVGVRVKVGMWCDCTAHALSSICLLLHVDCLARPASVLLPQGTLAVGHYCVHWVHCQSLKTPSPAVTLFPKLWCLVSSYKILGTPLQKCFVVC